MKYSKKQAEAEGNYRDLFSFHFYRKVHNFAPNNLHLDEHVCVHAYSFPLKQKSLEFT